MAWEPNKPVVIEEIEVAPPQANEVRIKVRDVHLQDTHISVFVLLQFYNFFCPCVKNNLLDAVWKVRLMKGWIACQCLQSLMISFCADCGNIGVPHRPVPSFREYA